MIRGQGRSLLDEFVIKHINCTRDEFRAFCIRARDKQHCMSEKVKLEAGRVKSGQMRRGRDKDLSCQMAALVWCTKVRITGETASDYYTFLPPTS